MSRLDQKSRKKIMQIFKETGSLRATAKRAYAARHVATTRHAVDISRVEGELLATADPRIDKEIGKLKELFESRRHDAIKWRNESGELDLVTMTRERRVHSNYGKVERWMIAIREAIEELEGLKSQAIEHDKLHKKIDALIRAVPELPVREVV